MTEFYVSSLGNDVSAGTSPRSAFASLDAAIKAMADSEAANTTYVLGGTYYLDGAGLSLTSANSNDTIAAYPGTNPVISGGTAVPHSGWTVDSKGVWSTQLDTSDVAQFVVDGRSQTLARYPNKGPDNPIQGGWLWAQPLPSGANLLRQMAYNPADFPSGQAPTAGERVTLFDANNWSSSVLKITAVDTAAHVITFDKAVSYYIGPGSRYFIAGSHTLLDKPGEWYFDQSASKLYFNPPAGFDGTGAVVSGNSSLINISDAQNITIKGLGFSDVATNARTEAEIATAAVNLNASKGIVIEGNHFTHVAQGIRIVGGSNSNAILHNEFRNIWAQAVLVGAGTSGNRVSHNSIDNSGEVFAAPGAVHMENTASNIVSNNYIRYVPRSGISDIQSDPNVKSGGNVIEYNTILHSGQATNDSGAIYVALPNSTSASGNVIRFNKIVDTGGVGTTSTGFTDGQYESAGIYVEGGANGVQIQGNQIAGTTLGGIFLRGSNNNEVYGNLISEHHQLSDSVGGAGISLVPIGGADMTGNAIHDNVIELLSSDASLTLATDASSDVSHNFEVSGTTVSPEPTVIDQRLSVSSSGSSNKQGGYSQDSNFAIPAGVQDLPRAEADQADQQNQIDKMLPSDTVTTVASSDPLSSIDTDGAFGVAKVSVVADQSAANINVSLADVVNVNDSGADVTSTLDTGSGSSSAASNTGLPKTISSDAFIEIDGVSAQSVDFVGTSGTLKLDDAVGFTGQVSGIAGSDALDLADVSYGANTTATFLGNATGGTLTVSDGTETANIDLTGNYLASSWDLSSDGHGGTTVVDPVSSNTWQTLDVGAGGYVDGLDIAPDGTMVARTDTYGAYIWNGTEWQQLVSSTSMPAAFVTPSSLLNDAQGVYEIQIAPSNSNILYMMYEGYVFESSNKGTTWTQTAFAPVTENPNGPYRMDGQKMAVDPDNPNIVYVGTPQNGLFATTNGGATWQSVSAVPVGQSDGSGNYPGITGIEFDPALGVTGGKTNTIFAASYGDGVYESTNAGASWSAIGGPGNVVYAAVSSTGVYYATDGTTLWSYANSTWTQLVSEGNGIEAVAVDPSNPNEIVAQTPAGYLEVSYNGGATWSGVDWSSNQVGSTDIPWLASGNTEAAGPVYLSVAGLAFNPLVANQLIASAGTGVWTSDLPTDLQWTTPVIWNDQSAGIEQLVANEIIVPPGGDPVLASWDRPFFYISNANAYPSTYGPVPSANIVAGWSVDYASSNPSFLVGLADWFGGSEESGFSTNGGQTWTAFPTFIPGAGTSFMGGTIAASSPTNIVWAPADGNQPYYTLNGGETWNPITLPGVSSWGSFDWAYYLDTRTVTADRVLPNTFYLYYGGVGVFETTNGGASWTEVHTGSVSPADTYNSEIQSVPGEAGNLFFTAGPQSGPQPDGIGFYRSTDQGATWSAVANVTDVSCFGYGAAAPGQSYPSIYIVGWVNNVYGIWQSINNAQSWTQIGTYPNSSLDQIKTISGDPNTYGQVYVGFQGSGYAYLPATSVGTGPVVSAITASPSSGDLDAGHTVTLTLTMSETVTVAGGTPTLTLNDGGTATYSGGSGTGTLTFSYTIGAGQNTSSLAVSTVSLNSATITDGAGNAASLSLTGATETGPQIDTTAPAAPAIANDIINANDSVTLTGTAEANSTVTVYNGQTALGTTTTTGSGAWNYTTSTLAPGTQTFTATATDAAGNTSAASTALDPTIGQPAAPTIVSFSPDSGVVGDGITNATTLALTGTAVANSTIAVFDGSTELGTTTANASGAWSYTTGTLTNGSHSFTATDAVGSNLSSASAALGVTIDTRPPPVTVSLASNTGTSSTPTTTSNIALTGSGDPNAVVTLREGNTVLGTTMANANGEWSFTSASVAQGSHTIVASEADAAGNTGSASLTFTLDTEVLVAPSIASLVSDGGTAGGEITNTTTLVLTGTAVANSTVEVFDSSTELGTATASGDGGWSYRTSQLANGPHSLTATDSVAGNVSPASAALIVSVDGAESHRNGSAPGNFTAGMRTHGSHSLAANSNTLGETSTTPSDASTVVQTANHTHQVFGSASPAAYEAQPASAAATDANSNPTDILNSGSANGAIASGRHSENGSQRTPTPNPIESHLTANSSMVTLANGVFDPSSKEIVGSGQSKIANPTLTGATGAEHHAHSDYAISITGDTDRNPLDANLSVLAGGGTDAFLFKPNLGNESAISDMAHAASDNLADHLFATVAELHADVHGSSVDSATALDLSNAPPAGEVSPQNIDLHSFHLV